MKILLIVATILSGLAVIILDKKVNKNKRLGKLMERLKPSGVWSTKEKEGDE
tara:strand:- start:1824 stop:1979 length:156 start_codon:yes stop_codon:yes gene_type:complete